MLSSIIEASANNKFIVILVSAFIAVGGYWAMATMPLDAIPDLSDVQVIIYTEYEGQTPKVVEEQVTYPITTSMLSVPYAKTVRGFSYFGYSFVYVIFEEGTDLYWARSRVLEYLNYAAKRLPAGITPNLGPDATGVGWVYEYAIVDRTGKHDLAGLRTIQDWFLRYELQRVPGVSEVASVGGFVKQYQVEVDPNKLVAYGVTMPQIISAIQMGNNDVDGRLIEMAETEYMVRGFGYIKSIEDLKKITLSVGETGAPVQIKDVANVIIGPELRRGLVDLDGEGDVAGGVVIMRFGGNALQTIELVKRKMEELKKSLPEGVEIVTTYDRSALIHRAVAFLKDKLFEESLIVAMVCMVFLLHLRSAFVAILTLPMGILISMLALKAMGVSANIMSLGGIAIAIGAMIDASVVMIENAHKRLERAPEGADRARIVLDAAKEVGPALFFSLVIITLSFLPVFALEAQEGRLFKPLAFTKTFAMAGAAALSITLTPVLMIYLVRGSIVPERKNPINLFLLWATRPVVGLALRHKALTLLLAAGFFGLSMMSLNRLGSEFMPPLDEGDILYMPTTLPGISITKAREVLQQTDKIIRSFPEVERVFGKIGRAETATDSAPLMMVETVVKLKPREQWRPGMDMKTLTGQMDQAIRFPGLTNAWTMPIKTRTDMLSTGIKTPVGVKVAGPDLKQLDEVASQIETSLRKVKGTRSAVEERSWGGNYVDFIIDRDKIARYGLNVGDVQEVIKSAIGGMNVSQTVEGLERYPINVRYGRELRDDLEKLKRILVLTHMGQQVAISQLADIKLTQGAMTIKTENSKPNAWIYVDIEDIDVGTYVRTAKKQVDRDVKLPPGVSISWSGQYEYMERVRERLTMIVPFTIGIILLLLYLYFRNVTESLLVLLTAPLSAAGGLIYIDMRGFNLSVAVGVGFIALVGVAAEIGSLILVYIGHEIARRKAAGLWNNPEDVREAVLEGVSERVRPIMMTVCAILGGLAPIMYGSGTGAEIMQRIATPMVGGMISVTAMSLVALPALYCLILELRMKYRMD
jgi:Cu(I)/Ag(I) efflux system membrane protein CusA/SilA